MRRIEQAALALGMVALLAAGCGGGDDDKGLSKADYVKQGNAICAKGNAEIEAAIQKVGPAATDAQKTAVVTGTLVPTISTELEDLRALKAPEADADKLSKLYDDADAALAKIKADPSLAFAESDPFDAVNKEATAYGLTACGAG